MSKKPSRKTLVRKLDKIVGDIVKLRDGKCIVCNTTKNLTSGHLFSRVAYSTRWDLDNCYAQCLSCNFRHESDPYPMTQSVLKKHRPRIENMKFIGLIEEEEWLDELHREYVTPHKFKDFELEELYNKLCQIKANFGS